MIAPIKPVAIQCKHCGYDAPDGIKRVKRRISNGTYQVFDECKRCGRMATGSNLKHTEVGDLDQYPTVADYSTLGICERCGRMIGVEYHHYAPRHIFQDEAESFYKGYLCRECHNFWHETILKHFQTCDLCKRWNRDKNN